VDRERVHYAAQQEQKRRAEEQEQRRHAEEQEQRRFAEEEEQKRRAEEQEQRRRAEEQEQTRRLRDEQVRAKRQRREREIFERAAGPRNSGDKARSIKPSPRLRRGSRRSIRSVPLKVREKARDLGTSMPNALRHR